MAVTILFFGQLQDIAGVSQLEWPQPADSDSLMQQLKEKFPALSQATFAIAVNNALLNTSIPLADGMQIALLPPFSGG